MVIQNRAKAELAQLMAEVTLSLHSYKLAFSLFLTSFSLLHGFHLPTHTLSSSLSLPLSYTIQDPLPLRRARITLEAALRKAERTSREADVAKEAAERALREAEERLRCLVTHTQLSGSHAGRQGALWWMERELGAVRGTIAYRSTLPPPSPSVLSLFAQGILSLSLSLLSRLHTHSYISFWNVYPV